MIILIDVGNSSLKWCLYSDTKNQLVNSPTRWLYQSKVKLADQLDTLFGEISKAIDGIPSQILVSCVKPSVVDELNLALAKRKWPAPSYARVTHQFGNLVNSYTQPEKMGVDRWLAMIAASGSGSRSAMVADLGTALTIDLVGSSGHHLGGLITAGIHHQIQSLLSHTENVHSRPIKDQEPLMPGQNTEDCVVRGALIQMVSYLAWQMDYAKQQGIHDIILTGGDSEWVADLPGIKEKKAVVNLSVRPALVFEGLLTNLLNC